MEYSLNDSDYVDLEVGYEWSEHNERSKPLDLVEGVNRLIVREKDTQTIYLRAILIKKDDDVIVFEKAEVGWEKGSHVSTTENAYDKIEYSTDNGNTFSNTLQWPGANIGQEIFTENFIIREKNNTENIIYTAPILNAGSQEDEGEAGNEVTHTILEQYVYENGKTIINFKQKDLNDSITKYEYIIDGETKTGNSIEIEEDAQIKLKLSSEMNFISMSAEKEINAKVIKVEIPEIKTENNGEVTITAGNIKNDDLEAIYYNVDGGEYKQYNSKIILDPGEHTIEAYQVSKNKNVKSEKRQKEITVEEPKENIKQEAVSENSNVENNINESIKDTENIIRSKQNPTTGDNIFKYVSILVIVISINIVIIVINKHNRKIYKRKH